MTLPSWMSWCSRRLIYSYNIKPSLKHNIEHRAKGKGSKETHTYSVSYEQMDERLDKYLSGHIHDLSRSQIQKLIKDGFVLVDGERVRSGHRLKPGNHVEVRVPVEKTHQFESYDIPLNIVYEDDSLLVLDKRAGLVVHPGAGRPSGTLVTALMLRGTKLSTLGGENRPGIVHRLDRDTSGIMVVAKDDRAHESLSAQFKAHSTERIYRGIIWGRMGEDRGVIEKSIGRHPVNRTKMTTNPIHGREAITEFRVLERFSQMTYAEFMPKTGRTHQIRVHMASVGHPLVGDRTYGSMKAAKGIKVKRVRDSVLGIGRHLLHAASLGFIHPETGDLMRFESPLPEDMSSILEVIRSAE